MTDEEEFEEFQKKLAEEIKESIEFMNDFNERMKKLDKSEIKIEARNDYLTVVAEKSGDIKNKDDKN